jgi:hypothetical protein
MFDEFVEVRRDAFERDGDSVMVVEEVAHRRSDRGKPLAAPGETARGRNSEEAIWILLDAVLIDQYNFRALSTLHLSETTMIAVCYYLIRILLALLHGLVQWRVSRLENRFVTIGLECDEAAKGIEKHPRQEETLVGRLERESAVISLVGRKRSIESAYLARQKFSERLGGLRTWLKTSKSRVVPYVTSLMDVATALVVGHYHGWTADRVIEAVSTFIGRVT